MKKHAAIALFLLLAFLVSGCTVMNTQKEIAAAIGVELPAGEVISTSDTHGGFHGDGVEYTVLQFEEDVISDRVSELEGWHELPLTDNVQILLYGRVEGDNILGPFLKDDDGEPLLPEISNGYYFFEDRFSEAAEPYDDSGIFERGAFNLTTAIYDTDTNCLYYIRFDT